MYGVIFIKLNSVVLSPKDANGRANSVDPNQTTPSGFGSKLFAKTCLSEILGSSEYLQTIDFIDASLSPMETRAVRGSDYSPAIALSSEKDKLSPVKRICVFKHSVMTNCNCACPAIQRG